MISIVEYIVKSSDVKENFKPWGGPKAKMTPMKNVPRLETKGFNKPVINTLTGKERIIRSVH